MKIKPIHENLIKVETENGHDFDIYALVGGGIEVHPIKEPLLLESGEFTKELKYVVIRSTKV